MIVVGQNREGSAGRSSHQFMLRLWLEELGNDQYELRGSVQHMNSGEMRYFRDWATLETFVDGHTCRTLPEAHLASKGEEAGGHQIRR
jgi:hypothetical protein